MGGSLAIAGIATRKAFINEAVLECLEHQLAAERNRFDRQRSEDCKADADRWSVSKLTSAPCGK